VQEDVDYYRIGTIARMTGLSVERLRAWERRYEFVPAHREGKTRYYSREQLERLQKIKRLVDAGHSISSLVDLSDQHLDARLTSRTTATAQATLRVGIVGPNLIVSEQSQTVPSRLSIEERWSNMPAFMTAGPELSGHFDVLVAQVTVLSPETVNSIRKKTGKAALVLLYQFATADQVKSVQDEGIPVLHWPASWSEIETACAAVARTSLLTATAAEAVFTDDELIAIGASDKQSSGLPRFLVDAILQLNSLAEFALDCADQDSLEGGSTTQSTVEQVHIEVTRARAQLESALQLLVQNERLQATAH
jgi:DNA-binding transcriptional MerR regulator